MGWLKVCMWTYSSRDLRLFVYFVKEIKKGGKKNKKNIGFGGFALLDLPSHASLVTEEV